jgi:hypothetical protein
MGIIYKSDDPKKRKSSFTKEGSDLYQQASVGAMGNREVMEANNNLGLTQKQAAMFQKASVVAMNSGLTKEEVKMYQKALIEDMQEANRSINNNKVIQKYGDGNKLTPFQNHFSKYPESYRVDSMIHADPRILPIPKFETLRGPGGSIEEQQQQHNDRIKAYDDTYGKLDTNSNYYKTATQIMNDRKTNSLLRVTPENEKKLRVVSNGDGNKTVVGTPFQNFLKKYPNSNPNDTLINSNPVPQIFGFARDYTRDNDLKKAYQETYGEDYEEKGAKLFSTRASDYHPTEIKEGQLKDALKQEKLIRLKPKN